MEREQEKGKGGKEEKRETSEGRRGKSEQVKEDIEGKG